MFEEYGKYSVNRSAKVVNSRWVKIKEIEQRITLESMKGTERDDGSLRSPKLAICVFRGMFGTSAMLTHDENLKIIHWYRQNDREWDSKLRGKIQQILDSPKGAPCPEWDDS